MPQQTTLSHLATTERLFFDQAGLDDRRVAALVQRGLAGSDDGELFLEYRQSEGLVFDDGRVKTAAFDTSKRFGLRAVAAEARG